MTDLGVRRLLRFDHLHDDFHDLCEHLSLPVRLPHLNQSQKPSIRSILDDELVSYIGNRFAAEIDLLQLTPPAF